MRILIILGLALLVGVVSAEESKVEALGSDADEVEALAGNEDEEVEALAGNEDEEVEALAGNEDEEVEALDDSDDMEALIGKEDRPGHHVTRNPDQRTTDKCPEGHTTHRPPVRTTHEPCKHTTPEPPVRTTSEPPVRTTSEPPVRTTHKPHPLTTHKPQHHHKKCDDDGKSSKSDDLNLECFVNRVDYYSKHLKLSQDFNKLYEKLLGEFKSRVNTLVKTYAKEKAAVCKWKDLSSDQSDKWKWLHSHQCDAKPKKTEHKKKKTVHKKKGHDKETGAGNPMP